MQKDKPLNTVKKRVETMDERLSRLTHLYDDGPKPKHLDDKSIVTMEDWSNMKPLNKKTPIIKTTPKNIGEYFSNKEIRPKPFKNDDPTTYPSNQSKNISTWEILVNDAKNPKTKDDRIQAREVRATILEKYKDKNTRKSLGDDELKLIGKHKSQIKYPEIPKIDINYKPYVTTPTPSLKDVMNSPRVKPKFQPGLSEDLMSLQSDIQKNLDYVLGKKEERSESMNEEDNNNNKEKSYD